MAFSSEEHTVEYDTYVFENGSFSPHPRQWADGLALSDYLQSKDYAEEEQVWGDYPDVYIKVYETRREASEFPFIAILNLVAIPHCVFIRDLNGLLQLLNLLAPAFRHHSRPDQDVGDALYGTHDAG